MIHVNDYNARVKREQSLRKLKQKAENRYDHAIERLSKAADETTRKFWQRTAVRAYRRSQHLKRQLEQIWLVY